MLKANSRHYSSGDTAGDLIAGEIESKNRTLPTWKAEQARKCLSRSGLSIAHSMGSRFHDAIKDIPEHLALGTKLATQPLSTNCTGSN